MEKLLKNKLPNSTMLALQNVCCETGHKNGGEKPKARD
jgi:hypothetical protein